MKDETLKNCISISVIILAVLSIIFGCYLPFAKSRRYITALESVQSVKTVQQFEANFDKSLKYYSPIGDEEVVKFLANLILQLLMQQNQAEAVDRMLVNYIEPYLFKNDTRHLLAGSQMHQILLTKYNNIEDLQKMDSYMHAAYAIGPKLPPVLYNLFDIYRMEKNIPKAEEIGQEILEYWPDAQEIKNILGTLK